MAALVLDARPGSQLDGLGAVPSGIEATTNQTLQGTDSPPAEAKAEGHEGWGTFLPITLTSCDRRAKLMAEGRVRKHPPLECLPNASMLTPRPTQSPAAWVNLCSLNEEVEAEWTACSHGHPASTACVTQNPGPPHPFPVWL